MWKFSEHKNWQLLLEEWDFVRDMKGVRQDPGYHAEGDVAIHTEMVLSALQGLEEWKSFSAMQQEVLWTAALLHDVEKRSTTVLERDGSISSKGHAKKGAMTARQLLYIMMEAPFLIREEVVALVRYHGLPLWVFEKKDPVKAVIEASLHLNTKLLAALARADVLGRICSDQEELLYKVDLFAALCEEQGCWGQPFSFSTPGARFHYFRQDEEAYPGFVPFDDYRSRVVMLSGLPGAGKDHYVFHHYRDWPVINLDEIRRQNKISPTDRSGNGRVIQMAKEQARIYLRAGKNFVWNATNVTRSMRGQLIDLFVTYKAYVKIVYVEVPFRLLQVQNNSRDAMLPQLAIDRLAAKLEVPSPTEAHEVEYVV